MTLDRALAAFLERVRPDDVDLGGSKKLAKRDELARASELLAADLDAARASINRWRMLTVFVIGAVVVASAFKAGLWQAAGMASAGGLTAALLPIWRKKFAGDLLIALLKTTEDPDQRVKLVRALREHL